MPISRAKPPGTLYDEVADYDLVVVPDNPLADAINRRLTESHFGTFATTPRRLATGRRESAEDRRAFVELAGRIDASWTAIAYAVGNVLQCWEHQGRHDAILDYDAYVDETTEAVVDAIPDLTTTSSELTGYEIPADRSVAVVDHDRLTELERSILPDRFDRVDPLTDDPFDRPPFHVFDSPAAIVDAVLGTVTAEDADDVAVVLDASGQFSSLIEAALAANDVPFYGGPGFADDPDHRCFLGLLRAAYRGSDTTVADVRALCSHLDIDVPVDHDEKCLDAVDYDDFGWFTEFCRNVESFTFGTALTCFERKIDREQSAFREELDALGLANESVSRDRVEDLAFYLQRYEVPVDRDDEGVLLADANSASFVDRPVVFHLGIGEDWIHATPKRPWVDGDALFDRHLREFQMLLQSGTERYYLVQDSAGGRPVTPCPYLGELLGEEFERFSDLESVSYARTLTSNARTGAGDGRQEKGFTREPLDVVSRQLDTISQSSLNSYVNSPRDYLFSRLVDGPERDYFTEGNLFHDFAEFYVARPDLVDDATIEEVVDLIHEEADAFYHADHDPLRRRRYRIGVEAIVEFLDERGPAEDSLDLLTPTSGWGTNAFGEHFEVSIDTPLAERWFENAAIGAKGKIDLVCGPGRLVDHKSGSKTSATKVVRRAAVDPPADTPNFQAALYLSHFRTVAPDERIDFSFFHFLEPLEAAIAGDADLADSLDDALTTVTYYPEPFAEFVASDEAHERLLDGYSDCVATFEDLGVDRYREIVGALSFPATTDREELRASSFASEFTAAVDEATDDDVDAEKGCDQAIRELNGIRRRAFFPADLDAVEAFLAERLAEINGYRAGDGRFPIEGPGGEPNYRRVDNRDLLLEGDGRE